jgi:cell division protein FtsB
MLNLTNLRGKLTQLCLISSLAVLSISPLPLPFSQVLHLSEQLEMQETQFLGYQAELEVLEAKHKDLEADIAALLAEKHAIEVSMYSCPCLCFLISFANPIE